VSQNSEARRRRAKPPGSLISLFFYIFSLSLSVKKTGVSLRADTSAFFILPVFRAASRQWKKPPHGVVIHIVPVGIKRMEVFYEKK
jgi:hypothetical protein